MRCEINFTLLTVLAVDVLAMAGDFHITWTSPILLKLYSSDPEENPLGKPITDDEAGWIGSLINIGAIIGPFPFGYISGKLGRKPALLLIAINHIFAYLTLAAANNIYLYYIARFVGGIALGGGYTLIPMYIAEIAEDSKRGSLSVTLNFFWCLGVILPYSIGPYVSVMMLNIILACFPAAFFIFFLLIAPETAYYLVGIKKIDKAEASIMKLRSRSRNAIQRELHQIQKCVESEETGSIKDILKSHALKKAFVISLVLIMAQQLSGINAIMFYAQPIFEAATKAMRGIISSDISTIVIGFVSLLTSFIVPFTADKTGRRVLLLISTTGIVISLTMIGTFFYMKYDTGLSTNSISWIPIASLILFVMFFNIGLSPVPWTITSELFPPNMRSFAATATSTVCWTTSFLVTKFFNDMNQFLGQGQTFWFFAICCCLAGIFTYFVVPETKGKSFREIQDELEN